jgi:predicted metal-dependent peptidase
MSQAAASDDDKLNRVAVGRAKQALRLASASLPHLSGLAYLVRVKASQRVSVAAVAPSGLVIIQPRIFAHIALADAAFVLAHELLHLALDTHGRQGEADRLLVNFAHDFVINDMLRDELERDPPLNGLDMPGAADRSLEELVVELSKSGSSSLQCWDITQSIRGPRSRTAISHALEDAGVIPPQPREAPINDPDLFRGDVLPGDREGEFEPEMPPELRRQLTDEVRRAAAKAASLSALKSKMDAAGDPASLGEPQRGEAMLRALRDAYQPPWELALQRWMDAVAPGERTYARPSRRGADRRDVVLPGRRREGWTLHIVLDTSGSMYDYLPKALGAIAGFCDASGVAEVHIVQCDVEVTSDRWVEPQELAEFKVAGFGYSDMRPAMRHLAEDPEVSAVLILTDGYIDYLADDPPYRVLWGLLGEVDASFNPPYGLKVHIRLM